MVEKIDHIGLVVKNIEETSKLYEKLFGIRCGKVDCLQSYYDQEGVNVKIAFLRVGDTNIELLEPSDGKYGDFLREKGEGMHHLAFKVSNIKETVEALERHKVKFIRPQKIMEIPKFQTKIAFINPRFTNGATIELMESQKKE